MERRNASRRGRSNSENFMDYSLLFIVLFLLAFGLLMVYSTSSYDANLDVGDSAYYLKKQIFATIVGLVEIGRAHV